MTSNELAPTRTDAPDVVLIAAPDGSITWASPTVETVFGRTPATVVDTETIGSLLGSVVASADPGEGPQSTVLSHPDDTRLDLTVTVDDLSDDVPMRVYTCRPSDADRTGETARVVSLERERDLTEQLLRASPVGVCVLDAEGQFVRVNERAQDILGVSRDHLLDESYRNPDWQVQRPDGTPLPDSEFPFAIALRTGETTLDHVQTLERPDGSRIWVSVSAAPVSRSGGAVDRVVVTFEDISEQKAQQARLEADEAKYRALFEGTLDALILTDAEGYYVDGNPAACALYGLEHDRLVGRHAAEFAPDSFDFAAAWQAIEDGSGLQGEFPLERDDGTVRIAAFSATPDVFDGHHFFALRDVTERHENEQTLRAQRRDLSRSNHVNTLFREIIRTVVGADTRADIETAVTETLVDTDLYSLAMMTTVTSEDEIDVTSLTGVDGAERDALVTPLRTAFADDIRAVTVSNEPLVVDCPVEDGTDDGDALLPALGIASVGHFPLAHDGTVYGVLTLGGTEDDVFTDSGRALFVDFGHLIGKAFTAIQTEKLLHGEVVLELEFGVPTESSPVAQLSDRGDCECRLSGVVPAGADVLYYLSVSDADSQTVCELAAEMSGIGSARVIDRSGGSLVELRVREDPAVQALLAGGGWLRQGTFDHGGGRLVVEVPADTDVRSFVETATEQVPGLSLLAKHEREQSLPATGTLHQQLQALLTDRQRAILEAAFRAGYFEWPTRRTTGGDLADAFDISRSTLHQHLRVAVSKLLEHYLAQSGR